MAVGIDDRLEKSTFERQDVDPAECPPLGKHGHDVAAEERSRSFVIDAARITFARALDEQCPHSAQQPADQWQPSQFGLGNEAHRMDRVQDEDIQPRHVIRHKQHVAVGGKESAVQPGTHIEHPEQPTRPDADQRPLSSRTQQRKHQNRGRNALQQMNSDARRAIQPYQERSLHRSFAHDKAQAKCVQFGRALTLDPLRQRSRSTS